MGRTKKYREGDWGLFSMGKNEVVVRIARCRKAVCFGFFYVFEHTPTLDELEKLSVGSALLASKFGDVPLVDGRWSIVRPQKWLRALWHMPPLVRYNEIDNVYLKSFYDDDMVFLREEVISKEDVENYWEDILETEITVQDTIKRQINRRET